MGQRSERERLRAHRRLYDDQKRLREFADAVQAGAPGDCIERDEHGQAVRRDPPTIRDEDLEPDPDPGMFSGPGDRGSA
jgi:hypothetical protein